MFWCEVHVLRYFVLSDTTEGLALRIFGRESAIRLSSVSTMISVPFLLSCVVTLVTASSIPNTIECCRQSGVPSSCANIFCSQSRTPDEMEVWRLGYGGNCSRHAQQISQCLVDGRNNSPCCASESELQSETSIKRVDVCFDWCDGSATPLTTRDPLRNSPYMQCLVWNMDIIYKCALRGYSQNPGPPRHLSVGSVGTHTAILKWHSPTQFPNLVDSYKVYYGIGQLLQSVSTNSNSLTLHNLSPDTKYSVYVVAHSNDPLKSSAKSKLLHFVTDGVSPKVHSYKNKIQTALKTDVTLVCRAIVPGNVHPLVKFQWEKKDKSSGRFIIIKNTRDLAFKDKFAMESYKGENKADGNREYINALTIKNITNEDYGRVRCVGENEFGRGHANMRISRKSEIKVPLNPVNLTECCLQKGIPLNCCLQITSKRSIGALSFSPQCILYTDLIFQCSNQDYGACCLKNKVPSRCLFLCDSTLDPKPFRECMPSRITAIECLIKSKTFIPTPPENLQIVRKSHRWLMVRWSSVQNATEYYIFHRIHGGKWSRNSLTENSIRLNNLNDNTFYDIIVIAANDSGHSGNSRLLTVLTGDHLTNSDIHTYKLFNKQLPLRGEATGNMQQMSQHGEES